eukprot:gene28483-31635_t
MENHVDFSQSGHRSDYPNGQGFVMLEPDGAVTSIVVGGANTAWETQAVEQGRAVLLQSGGPVNDVSDAVAVAEPIHILSIQTIEVKHSPNLSPSLVDQVKALLQPGGAVSALLLQREVPEEVNEAVAAAGGVGRRGRGRLVSVGGAVESLLLQREIPEEVNEAVAAAAVAAGIPVLLDVGGRSTDSAENIIEAAKSLQTRGARNVMVTLGDKGSLLLAEDGSVLRQEAVPVPGGQTHSDKGSLIVAEDGSVLRLEAIPVPGGHVVDATGAGDSFRSAFAVCLVEALQTKQECMKFAAVAGALAVSKPGAVPSLPTLEETLAYQEDLAASKLGAVSRPGAVPSLPTLEETLAYQEDRPPAPPRATQSDSSPETSQPGRDTLAYQEDGLPSSPRATQSDISPETSQPGSCRQPGTKASSSPDLSGSPGSLDSSFVPQRGPHDPLTGVPGSLDSSFVPQGGPHDPLTGGPGSLDSSFVPQGGPHDPLTGGPGSLESSFVPQGGPHDPLTGGPGSLDSSFVPQGGPHDPLAAEDIPGVDNLLFASRLNSMKSHPELWSGATDVPEMQLGAFSNPDPGVRRRAVELTIEGCQCARLLGAQELIVWSAYDGYDYHLQGLKWSYEGGISLECALFSMIIWSMAGRQGQREEGNPENFSCGHPVSRSTKVARARHGGLCPFTPSSGPAMFLLRELGPLSVLCFRFSSRFSSFRGGRTAEPRGGRHKPRVREAGKEGGGEGRQPREAGSGGREAEGGRQEREEGRQK